jgi:hypothetical protein
MSIEFCPRCSARVRVPIGADPESWVRCPRCRVEQQLSEILSAEPPLLELIDGPSGELPSYEPMLAGVGAAGESENFHVASSDTMIVDEDSPTLPLGGISLNDDIFDDAGSGDGATIGTASSGGDDELFGFDDNADVASLRTTSEDGKFVDVPSEGGEGFELSPDAPAEFGGPATATAPAFTGMPGIATGKPRRKKKSGIVPMMIGVVGGGLFGILIAYYGILMWAMGMDPFKVAKYFPESMQMLLPASLQNKALAGKSNPPPISPDINDENSNSTEPMMPEEGNMPNEAANAATANGEGEVGKVPGLPSLGGGDTNPDVPAPMNDPLDPLAMPEKPATPAVDPLDPLASATAPAKPAVDPLDPLAAPIKPEMPAKPAVDPLDPLNSGAPLKPETPAPAVDPLDPLASATKPEMPLDPLAKPVDPLAPAPVDPLAPPAKAKTSEPLMLTSANFPPEELLKSLMQVDAATMTLAQTPDDRKLQAGVYRALSHVGEVAGQMKSLGETEETAQVNLDSINALAKKLADDATIPVITKLTSFWLTIPVEKRNNGIVLHGTPGTSETVGKLHKTSMEIPGADPAQPAINLSVVSEYPLLPGKDGKVTLLGVIVEKPSEQIPGYTGPAERVIWASVAPMEKPATAPASDVKAPDAASPAPSSDPFGDIK